MSYIPPNNTLVDFSWGTGGEVSLGTQQTHDFTFQAPNLTVYYFQDETQVNATWVGADAYTTATSPLDVTFTVAPAGEVVTTFLAGLAPARSRVTAFRVSNGRPLWNLKWETTSADDETWTLEVPLGNTYIVFCIDSPADFYNVYDWITPA